MMVKIGKLVVIFLCLFVVCCLIARELPKKENYELYVNQIVSAFAKEMKDEFHLFCKGEGGSMPHDVESIDIHFKVYRRATIEDARELEVAATERLLKMINAHEKIRPYLREYPFKSDRVNIGISFKKLNNDYYDDRSVAFVFQAKNTIVYCANDNDDGPLIDLAEEPYDEALQIVQNSPSKLKLLNVHKVGL